MRHPVTLSDVVAYLDLLLAVSPEDDREGNGIAYTAGDTVAKLGAAVNTSLEAIERAAELGVDLLLVHHTSWQGIDFELRERKLALLAERRVSLYAAHESLDRAPSIGTADALARLLGLTVESRALGGYAVVGVFADRSLSALAARTEKALRTRVRAFRNSESFERGAIAPRGRGGHLVPEGNARAWLRHLCHRRRLHVHRALRPRGGDEPGVGRPLPD